MPTKKTTTTNNNTIPLSQAQRETLEAFCQAYEAAKRERDNFITYLYREHEITPDQWSLRNTSIGFQKNPPAPEPEAQKKGNVTQAPEL